MYVDWEYLRGVAQGAGDWEEAQLEELYQALVGITRLRTRDKTVDKLEMLFTLSQAVMLAKHTQASALEEELGHLAESAGRKDAKRERELQQEVERLQALMQNGATVGRQDEHIAYDWSSGWRLKKKEMEESLSQKNMEIHQFMDDLQACEEERTTLRTSVVELEERLAEATKEISSLTSDYLQLKESHKHVQERLITVQGEVEGVRSHVEELSGEKARIQQRYDELSAAVDARVDQLEVVVKQREEELQNVKAQLQQRSMLVSGAHIQGESARTLQLEKELKERKEEVSHLSQQLKEATKEIDSSAVIIAQLKKAKVPPATGEGAVITQLRGELSDARKQLQQMRTQLLTAEEDAQLHAQDLSTVIGELQSHLAGEFSLADAVRELKEVRSQVRMRDTQLTQLTGLVNTLQININDLLDENCQLREQLNLEPREDIDLPGVKKTHWQESKSIIERLTNQVNKLQDEKVSLRTRIYEMTRELSNTKSSLQLTTIEVPKAARPDASSGQQLQSLEGQISHLSAAVGQFLQQHQQDYTDYDTQAQLEPLKEKCLRLEGEKASLERIIQNELKRKKPPEKEETPRSPQERVTTESIPEPASRSPTAALEQLIKALGDLPPSTEEIIAKLKNQVIYLMQECSKREEEISEREKTVNIYTTQFEGLRVQVSDLNALLAREQVVWQTEKAGLEKAIHVLEGEMDALKAQKEELQLALDTLSSSQPGIDAKLGRRLAELRYDLEIAKRLSANQEKDITSLHQQLKERLEALQQSLLQAKQLKHEDEKEQGILKHRIYQLENELGQCVPRTAADQTCAQLATTTAKYRSLLQTQSLMLQEKTQGLQLEAEKQQLLREREQLSQQLESAREKMHSLQASLNLVGGNTTPVQPQVALLSKQLAAVELRELAQKQKAEHATVMYENIKGECEELHRRVQELQGTLATTSNMNLILQTTEAELRHRLQGAILPQEYETVTKKVEDLTNEKAQLSSTVQHLKTAVDVMETQMKQRQLLESVSQIELEQLREETQDLAAISDERSKIHYLHQEITFLKVKNLELIHQVEEMKVVEEKQSAEVFRMAQQMRDRERLLETSTDTSRARATRLHLIIRDLRQQYAGAVPLSQQEQLVEILETMRQERNSLQQALLSAQHDKMESHITLRQLKIKQEALDDLKTALSSSKPSSHVSNWCTKLEEARLRNVELEEKMQVLESNESLHLKQLERKEQRISELQTQLIALEKMWMNEQLVCDEREAELNEALAKHEKRHKEAVINRKPLTLLDIPDTSLPLPKQLEEALECLRNKVSLLEIVDKETEKLKDENSKIQRNLREKEIEVIARDKIINELRQLGKATKEFSYSEEKQDLRDTKNPTKIQPEESIKVVMEGLKERLCLSQNTVTHYQNLLTKEHEEKQDLIAKYKDELYHMTQKRDETQAKVRELQSQLDSIPTHDFSSSSLKQAQIVQIQNLEGTLKIVEKQLEESKTQLNASEKKVMQLERDLAISHREHAEEKDHMEVSNQVRIQQHQREVERLSGEIHKLRAERDQMQKDISALRNSANRTPSAIMRTLVEKLRDQLIEKEKQVAKLSLAVNDMKESISQEEAKQQETDPVNIEKEVSQVTSRLTESFKAELEKVSAERDDLQKQYNEQSLSLTEMKEKTSAEIENLNKKVKTLMTEKLKIEKLMLQQKNVNSTLKQRLEDMEGRSAGAIARAIENLQGKLERMEGTEEVQESEARKARSHEQVVRWEERKKLKVAMDKLKTRIKELETTQEDNVKKLNTSRELLSRVEKEKLSLQHKFNTLSKLSTEKLCRVCLKTLDSVEMGSVNHTMSSPGHSRQLMRQMRVSPSPERIPSKKPIGSTKKEHDGPTVSHTLQSTEDENEIKFRLQLKKALDEKHSLESRLHDAVEEVAALRYRLQQKEEEEEERLMADKKSPAGRRKTGAAMVLEYESRITTLEEQLRQKSRLLSHVKGVVQEAAAREETLLREKEVLLQKLTLLESISEDTPSARLVHELRQAKLTVTRLQRQLDKLQNNG